VRRVAHGTRLPEVVVMPFISGDRDEWVGATRGAEVVARMTGRLLDRGRGACGLDVPANEVLHEPALDELRSLPGLDDTLARLRGPRSAP
jgi:hypothetical protein